MSALQEGIKLTPVTEVLRSIKIPQFSIPATQIGYFITSDDGAVAFRFPLKYIRSERTALGFIHFFSMAALSIRIVSDRQTKRLFAKGEMLAAGAQIIDAPSTTSQHHFVAVTALVDGKYFDLLKDGDEVGDGFDWLDHAAHATIIGVPTADIKLASPGSKNSEPMTSLHPSGNEYTDAALGVSPEIASASGNSLSKSLPVAIKPIVLVPQATPVSSITYVAQGHEVVVKAKRTKVTDEKTLIKARVEAINGGVVEKGNVLEPKKVTSAKPTLDSWLETVIHLGSPLDFLMKKGASGIYDQAKSLILELKSMNYGGHAITSILHYLGLPLSILSDLLIDAGGGISNFKESLASSIKSFAGITKPIAVGLLFPGSKRELVMQIPGNLLPPPEQVDTLKLSAPIILKQLGYNPGSLKGTSCRVAYPDMERIIAL